MEMTDLKDEATDLVLRAHEITVTCDEQYSIAGEFVMGCKALIKRITEKHQENIDRWHQGHKAAIAERDEDLGPVKQALDRVSKVALAYKQEQDRLAREEAARIAAEQRKAEEDARLALAEKLEAQGDIEEAEKIIAAPAAPVRQTPFVTPVPKVAGLSTKKRWKFRITKPSQVNRTFCLPDESLCNRHVQAFFDYVKEPTPEEIKALEAEIGGGEVYQEEAFAGRVRA